ncbi:hypothetical protein BZG01_16775 [Labilibaculum manganireducens]|uniref:Uncharacterized protein n=1 Tax=Labilibaculum manganireducens TaxID=1940525 RepID=A0A2N3HY03_9BACT|nr:hypothetical protein BZG01_16775 [Labilibaculum manganireducens]
MYSVQSLKTWVFAKCTEYKVSQLEFLPRDYLVKARKIGFLLRDYLVKARKLKFLPRVLSTKPENLGFHSV